MITGREIRTLEFEAIREQLAGYTATPMGKTRALELFPVNDATVVRQALQETSEARHLLQQGLFTLPSCGDTGPALDRAARGGLLGGDDLVGIARFLAGVEHWKHFFRDPEKIETFPLIARTAAALDPCSGLAGQLKRSVGPEGEILDGASPALAGLRRRHRALTDNLRTRMDEYLRSPLAPFLQELLITRRGGRYVLPVKQEYRGRVPGIVHDQSASGATLFIEPAAIVRMHNEMIGLKNEEKKEIQRILASLSAAVAAREPELAAGREIYAGLDLVLARGRLSLVQGAAAPQLVSSSTCPPLVLMQARHPLLGGKAVPLDLVLHPRIRTLVVTGPNTGGKTVALKTVGLLAAMIQSGLHIPASAESRLGIFRRIRADIGDEQSIVQSLSTFSGHLKNIVAILSEAEAGDLVLLDELGAGTDPSEGAALAKAILEKLASNGVLALVTTHSSALKIFAQAQEEMQNASMEFDPETLIPTYRLLQGVPGQSNALAIAARLGLPAGIMSRARSYLDRDHGRVEKVIASLVEDQQRYSRESREAALEHARVKALRRELESELELLRQRREKILREAGEEARLLVRRSRAAADEILRELRQIRAEKGAATASRAEAARGRMQQLFRAVESEIVPDYGPFVPEKTPEVGKTVFVRALGQKGNIISLGDGEALVQVGSLRVQVSLEDLGQWTGVPAGATGTSATETGVGRGYTVTGASGALSTVDLRGQTVEEALPAVEKLLDRALLGGLHRVTVIHGKGTGRLKEGLRAYLQEHRLVREWRPGVPGEGGDGVTIVKL